jgi:hypothetical protein
MRRVLFLLIASALLAPACGDDDVPTDPSPGPVLAAVDVFVGTLAPAGASFYSFTMVEAGAVHVLVANVRETGTNVPATTPLALGIGRPQGTGCAITEGEIQVTPALAAQHKTSLATGVYCVNFADRGGLSKPVDFLIRIIYPADKYRPTGGTGSSTFASTMLRGGTASRAFGQSNGGTLTARLTSVTPPSGVTLALGVPALVSNACLVTFQVDVPAGETSELSVPADGGDYCVALIDKGQIAAESVNFSIDIIKP